MGYTSEVCIRCEEKAFKAIKEVCDNVNLHPTKCYKSDDDTYVLYFSCIKWYREYKEIAAVVNVLDRLDDLRLPEDDFDGWGYEFLRLGESDGDIEERYNIYYLELNTVRTIDLPPCKEEIGR